MKRSIKYYINDEAVWYVHPVKDNFIIPEMGIYIIHNNIELRNDKIKELKKKIMQNGNT